MNKFFCVAIILILSSCAVFADDKDKKSKEEEKVPVTSMCSKKEPTAASRKRWQR